MQICVAGKNNIAIECTDFLIKNNLISAKDLFVCFNTTDIGEDTFQRSFRKYSHEKNLKEVLLADLMEIRDLLFVSLEYDKLVPVDKFASTNLFNIHFSLLPKYKGMYTSAWPILNGETSSGVTLHKIDSGIDTGDIIDQIEFTIDNDDNCKDLYLNYISHGILLFKRNIANLISGDYIAVKQNALFSSYYSKHSIDYSNIKIGLNKTAFEIRNQIRAFNFSEYQVPRIFGEKIVSADILSTQTRKTPGSILQESKECFVIATIDYDLLLIKSPF